MAFSFKMNLETIRDIMEWKSNSSPSVDLCVNTDLICPFLVFESKSEDGSLLTAENQVGSAMVMMHDILCSLELNDTLHLFALVHVGLVCVPYISFSKRAVTSEGKTHCVEVGIQTMFYTDI